MAATALRSKLTEADIRRLVRSDDAQDRALATMKICRKIDRSALNADARAAAEQVLRFMAQDAAELVRRALSATLKASPHLPHDLARQLAADVDAVAVPVITHSPVFTDDDLIEILRASDGAKQAALARRGGLSASVVRAIAALGEEEAVVAAAQNDTAAFDTVAYDAALARFADSAAVTDAIIDRDRLPVTVSEKLVAMISEAALKRLVARHELPAQLAVELSEAARERATIDLADQAGLATDMRRFVQQLHLNGRLTPSLILRATCLGNLRFTEWALAELSGVPHHRAWLLIHDAGPFGLRAIMDHSGLPTRLYPVFRTAVGLAHELDYNAGVADRPRFARLMLERLLTRHQGLPPEELAYFLEKLDVLGQAERELRETG
ncbi:MAG: DUF2336 domain-containing protein [Maricaulaceae bacterium]